MESDKGSRGLPDGFAQTLLEIFERAAEDPCRVPGMPLERYPAGSAESRVLDALGGMLDRLSALSEDRAREQLEALTRSEERVRRLAENSSDVVYRYRLLPEPHLEYVNPAVADLTGYTPEQLYSDPVLADRLVRPDDIPLFEESRRLRAGEAPPRALRWVRKDEGLGWIDHRAVPVYDAGGTLVAIEGIARDVSRRIEAYRDMEQLVEDRTRELSALLEVSQNVASTLELKPLLRLILDQLKRMVDYVGAAVFTLHEGYLILLDYQGPIPEEVAMQVSLPLDGALANREVILRAGPVIVADVEADNPLARSLRYMGATRIGDTFGYARCWMGVPLQVKDRVIGMLTLDHVEPHHYTAHHARLALAVSQQAAVAIENARLYRGAQELAALGERQRLARELHDSISQSLFSMVLNARAARKLVERNPTAAVEPLDQLVALSAQAMTEMRALIFELRPESLEREGLVVALNRHVEALRARHKIHLHSEFCGEPDIPIEIKEAVYRIGQEAIHNAIRHAEAGRIHMRLECDDERILLAVEDDGVGFDPAAEFPGHLGLHSMRERAARAGGTLVIRSAPGQGTRLELRLPLPRGRGAGIETAAGAI